MTDYDVDVAIRKQLLLQLKEVGIEIPVKAGFQSTKQGREDNMVMFFPSMKTASVGKGVNIIFKATKLIIKKTSYPKIRTKFKRS